MDQLGDSSSGKWLLYGSIAKPHLEYNLMAVVLKSIFNLLLDLLYPKRCLGCGVFKTYLCKNCLDKIPFLERQVCAFCHKPSINGLSHLNLHRSKRLDSLLVMSSYVGLLKQVIRKYKYHPVPELSFPLGQKLVMFLEERLPNVDTVSFVPLTKSKQRRRGFNQAEVLASIICQKFKVPCLNLLEKTTDTPNQAELPREKRLANLKGVFKVLGKAKGKRILLVDDVATTATTLNECAKVLKVKGAIKVYGAVLARGS